MTVEVELRSFISQKKYQELANYFAEKGVFQGSEEQESWYFDTPLDLRIQRSTSYAKVWLKKGKMHDEQREEIEVRVAREEFDNLAKLFAAIGYKVKIKWLRTRKDFIWQDISVSLDFTKGYGYILELEKKCEPEQQDSVLQELKFACAKLGIPITSKEEFGQAFANYEKNWKNLIID